MLMENFEKIDEGFIKNGWALLRLQLSGLPYGIAEASKRKNGIEVQPNSALCGQGGFID